MHIYLVLKCHGESEHEQNYDVWLKVIFTSKAFKLNASQEQERYEYKREKVT